ncbi:MAG: LuxR family transcriptional regulator [Betaproteobacteria bacterium]|nr:LuxR family transcriptional regulator [Betaproteobacteria bacterium]
MKVLVVDDHELIRQALTFVLKQLDPGLEVFEAGDCAQALQLACMLEDRGLILLDINLTGGNGLESLVSFRERLPGVPVVVLSASQRREDVTRAIDLGAMGFIPKSRASHVMIQALRFVLSGGVYLPADLLNEQSLAPRGSTIAGTGEARGDYRDIGLTERQAQVLALLVQGKPNQLICRDLDLAEGTVKIHMSAILKSLKVTNRTQAVIEVGRLGLKLPTGAEDVARLPAR